MNRAEALQIRFLREPRYRGILWAAVAAATYLLAYSLATTNAGTEFGDWPKSWELPIQKPIDDIFEWAADTFAWFFNPISRVIDTGLAGIDTFLLCSPGLLSPVAAASVVGVQARREVAGAALRCGNPVHRLHRVLGLRNAHFERRGSFSDHRRRTRCTDRHMRCLQQSASSGASARFSTPCRSCPPLCTSFPPWSSSE